MTATAAILVMKPRPRSIPEQNPPPRPVLSVERVPEGDRRRSPEQDAGRVGARDVTVPVDPWHQQEVRRTPHRRPTARIAAPETQKNRDRQAVFTHRSQPARRDVFHPVLECRMRQQAQLPCQRRVKIRAVAAVRPVVDQRIGIEQVAQV